MATNPRDKQQYALQTIFSFFLGLMVLAFIGIGVNTFYPEPEWQPNTEQEQLYRERDRIYQAAGSKELTEADQKRVDDLDKEIAELDKETQDTREGWARTTSIVLILFATAVMGVSLVRSEQLRVISNGLLLGGLFTMVYGVGWIIASGESISRFVVIVFALAVTVALGYLKFVRGREAAAAVAGAGGVSLAGVTIDDAAVAGLVARVDALEARAAAAARALGASTDEHDAT